MWWLILFVSLIGIKDTHIAGETLFLGVLWGCFRKRFTLESADWVKKMPPTDASGHHPICWGPELNKKVEEGWLFLFSCLFLRRPSSPALEHYSFWFLGLWTLWLILASDQELRRRLTWFLSLWTCTEFYHLNPWFPSLQMAYQQILGVPSLHNRMIRFP